MADGREPQAPGGVSPTGEIGHAEIEAIRRGDAQAFERVVRLVAPRLLRFARHLTGKGDEAEELVQETLVRALPALSGFAGRAALTTYLLRAVSNTWKNRLRSRSRSRLVAWLSVARHDPPDPAPSALDRLAGAERARLVRDAVAMLEPERRLVLLLREVEDLSYEEIAEVTGWPIGTVRSRLARAREELRRRLEGQL